MKMSKAYTILVIAMLLFGGVLFSSVLNPVSAKTDPPTATPTPNPTIAALENRIATLEYQQSRKLDDLTFEVSKQAYYLAGIALFISAVIAFFGVKTYNDIDRLVGEKIKSSLDKEYKKQVEEADLALLPIWVKDSKILDPIFERLELYQFKNLRRFSFYTEELLQGIIIVSAENESDEIVFRKFIETYQSRLNPRKTAFILYTGTHRADPKTIGAFPNLTLANMPATVGMAVINIGKTLQNISD